MTDTVLDELLQKAVTLYVRPAERESALMTFRGMIESARCDGAIRAVSSLTGVVRKEGSK
jgi:hypothetical protein